MKSTFEEASYLNFHRDGSFLPPQKHLVMGHQFSAQHIIVVTNTHRSDRSQSEKTWFFIFRMHKVGQCFENFVTNIFLQKDFKKIILTADNSLRMDKYKNSPEAYPLLLLDFWNQKISASVRRCTLTDENRLERWDYSGYLDCYRFPALLSTFVKVLQMNKFS